MSEPEAPRPQLLRLDFRPGSNLSWVGSALAVVAGALASHRLGPDASSLLTLILALLLADPLLGGLWNVLVFTDWTGPWRESTSRELTVWRFGWRGCRVTTRSRIHAASVIL
jgi:hypothetical protein